MHNRNSSQFKSRRKHSLGPVRRAHPASGATWNVQVVRGKITSRCLWHACRALAIGIILMLLGAGMATIGYYADELSIGREIRGNATVRVKNESRGFHLNNLSYAGPIVMGVGGFIVVAACVMTFEARDSAAKVVPARFKVSGGRNNLSKSRTNSSTSRRAATRWDHHLGVFRTSPACEAPPPPPPPAREALTAALVHFSKALGSNRFSTPTPRRSSTASSLTRRISRSGSVPNLSATENRASTLPYATGSPSSRRCCINQNHHHHHHQHHHQILNNHHAAHRGSRRNSISYRCVHKIANDSRLLHPGMLQLHRQALSVDEPGAYYRVHGGDSLHGSKGSIAIEVHGLTPGTAYIINEAAARLNKDRSKKSDTARRHVLSRQKPVEKEEPHSPRTNNCTSVRRRSSTASDVSSASKRLARRRASSVSRTPSMDSRVGVHHGYGSASVVEMNNSSPERFSASPRTPRRHMNAQYSTPSIEREFRSQLSVCSDPTNVVRALSCQSSIEPCVPEEIPEQEEKEEAIGNSNNCTDSRNEDIKSNTTTSISKSISIKTIIRPETLTLTIDNKKMNTTTTTPIGGGTQSGQQQHKYLYRSNSTRSFKKPKPKLKLSSELYEQIYFIGNNRTDDDNYNSIEVIDERRRKNFTRNITNADDNCSVNGSSNNQPNDTNPNSCNDSCKDENISRDELIAPVNNLVEKENCDYSNESKCDGANKAEGNERSCELDDNDGRIISSSCNNVIENNDVVTSNGSSSKCSDSEQLQETIDSKKSDVSEIV